jgi:hypothetical protein
MKEKKRRKKFRIHNRGSEFITTDNAKEETGESG